MEHYRSRNKYLLEKRPSDFSKLSFFIVGYIFAIVISLFISILIGFFPGGIITLLLIVIDYAGSFNMNGSIIIFPWLIESLLIFIPCFLRIALNIHEHIRS